MANNIFDDRAERRTSRRKLQSTEMSTMPPESPNKFFDVGYWSQEEVRFKSIYILGEISRRLSIKLKDEELEEHLQAISCKL